MKVSILVPIYCVEPFIAECAISLFEQSYKDLEFIFVNDCTPDKSMKVLQEIVDHYPNRREQTRIIHNEKNRGLGATRSVALAAATGDFIMYVDSDDVLSTDAVEVLCNQQIKTNADIIDGGYCRMSDAGLGQEKTPFHGNTETLIRLLLAKNTVSHNIWGRIIRRSLHTDNNIDFTEGINMAEDYSILPQLLFFGTRSYIDKVIYYYRINDNGTFACGLNRRNIFSFLGANAIVGNFMSENDIDHTYQYAYELGMLQTYHSALKIGLTLDEIDSVTSYKPNLKLFRSLHTLLCHQQTINMLRWTYLVFKWIYKKSIYFYE